MLSRVFGLIFLFSYTGSIMRLGEDAPFGRQLTHQYQNSPPIHHGCLQLHFFFIKRGHGRFSKMHQSSSADSYEIASIHQDQPTNPSAEPDGDMQTEGRVSWAYPEGGWEAWTCLLGSSLMMFPSFGFQTAGTYLHSHSNGAQLLTHDSGVGPGLHQHQPAGRVQRP